MTLSGYEALFFWIFGLAAIFAGLLTVMARNAVHSALFLISSLVSVAALFILARAEFIAGVQILVYVGGVMVLFLFVIMLVNVGAEERGRDEIFNNQRQVTASLIFCLLLVAGVLYSVNQGYRGLQALHPTTPELAAAQQATREQSLSASATGTSKMTAESVGLGGVLFRARRLGRRGGIERVGKLDGILPLRARGLCSLHANGDIAVLTTPTRVVFDQ